MNRVWPLPDASWTMPLTLCPRLGLDRDDVPAVAERDDRLLERVPELRADERVEPAPEPLVGDPHGRAQAAEARRGGIEQLADRIEAAGERGPQGRERVEVAAEVAQEWPAFIGEQRPEAGRGVERLGDLEELGGFQPPATGRALDRGADVARRPDPGAGPLLEEGPRLVRLVEPAGHDDRVIRWFEGLGQALGGRERGGRREPRPDGRELEQGQRAFVHAGGAVQRGDTDGWPCSVNRHGRDTQGSAA